MMSPQEGIIEHSNERRVPWLRLKDVDIDLSGLAAGSTVHLLILRRQTGRQQI